MNKKFWWIVGLFAVLGAQSLWSEELGIEQAIDMALHNSPEIKVSEADVAAQRNKEVSSWLGLGPRMSASYNHLFYDDKLKTLFGGQEITMRDDELRNGNLALIQPITGLFALGQLGRLEGKQKNLKQTGLRLNRAQIAFKTAEYYLRAQQSQRMWEISQASIEASQAQKKDGEAMLRAQRIHQGDLLKFELAFSQALSAEAQARSARDIALYALQELIGMHDEAPPALPALALSEETGAAFAPMPTLQEGLSMAIANRLEIKQAQQAQDIASVARLASYSKFFPSINFIAQMDRNFGTPSFSSPKESKMLGFNLSWDFFNMGAHYFEIREASDKMAKALYQKNAAESLIRLDLMRTMASLRAAHESSAFARKAVEQANEAYRIEKLQFTLGRSSATQLVLAETAKTKAHGNLVSVIADLKIQQLKLQQALGETRPRLERGFHE